MALSWINETHDSIVDVLSHALERANEEVTGAWFMLEYAAKSKDQLTEERDKWIAEWEALNKERAKIEDERDRYRILRDAASEASLDGCRLARNSGGAR